MANWLELPKHLLERIFGKLEKGRMDCLRFSAVCRQWRLMAIEKGRNVLPRILLMIHNYEKPSKLFSLSSTKTLRDFHLPYDPFTLLLNTCCGSLEGWLIVVSGIDDIYCLFNPLSRRKFVLPSGQHPRNSQVFVRRSSNSNLTEDYVVTCVQDNTLFFCRISDEKWTQLGTIGDGGNRMLREIICYNDKLYVFYCNTIEVFDLQTCHCLGIVNTKKPQADFNRQSCTVYVVTPEGDLLMITRYFLKKRSSGFVFHKLNVFDGNWNKVQSLGDQLVLFLGPPNSVCLRAREVPECRANSIYFIDDVRGSIHVLNFNIEDRSIKKVYDVRPFKKSARIAWFTPSFEVK